MVPSLAPVEACTAQWAPTVRGSIEIDAQSRKDPLARLRQSQPTASPGDHAGRPQSLVHAHRGVTSEMIIADPGATQFRVARARAHPQVPGSRRNPHQPFEHAGNVGAGQAEIAMAALLFDADETAILELAEVPACS